MAFLSNKSGLPQIYLVDINANNVLWPDQLTFAADRVTEVSFSPKDNLLIYLKDTGGNEKAQLFLLDPGTRQETALSRGFEGSIHLFNGWHPDGESFFFAANRRHKAQFDLYWQTLDGKEAKLLFRHEHPGYLWQALLTPAGDHIIVTRTANSKENTLFDIHLSNKKVEDVTPIPGARFVPIGFGTEGQLLLRTDANSNYMFIASLDLKSNELKPIIQVSWDIESAFLSPDQSRLIYSVNEGGASRLYLHTLGSNEHHPCPLTRKIGVVTMGRQAFNREGTAFSFGFHSATRSSDCYVWNLPKDNIYPITRSAHGGLALNTFAQPELVHFPSFDQLSIPAWLYLPKKQANPHPVIMVIHGGPEGQIRPHLHAIIQYFVTQGFAVFAPNVRGSRGYGKHFMSLDDVHKRPDAVADLASAAQWIKTNPELDPSRIAVYGGSYGGFMVLAALTSYPDLFKLGVCIVGISNLVTFLENTGGYRRAHREAEYGSLEHDRDFLETISPLNHLDNVIAPLMVIHGRNDPRVPVSEAEQLVKELKKRSITAPLMIFEDEGHGLVKLKNKRLAYPAIAEFLQAHL